MSRQVPYFLAFADAIAEHLRAIEVKYRPLIRAQIREQLEFEPDVETKNRKPLRVPAPFGATWDVRIGPNNRFGVLYVIDAEARTVRIMAIGEKKRERLLIGGKEVRQ